MKYLYSLCAFLILATPMYSLQKNEIEDRYSRAIDLRYRGDLARSRFLLESLYLEGVTNEYVLSILTEVYFDYLSDLAAKNENETIQRSYGGIRENIAKIWDMYPESEAIQKNAIRIAWGMGDMNFALAMSFLSTEKNPYHLWANYFLGNHFIQESNAAYACPYFKKVAKKEITENGAEQFIFQSRHNVGDMSFENANYTQAIEYYEKAMELSVNIELVVKLAMAYAHDDKFEQAISYFQQIPIPTLSAELFDAYVGVLYLHNTPDSLSLMNLLLSQRFEDLPPYSKALAFSRLGQTQKALTFLDEDIFLAGELPQVFYGFKIELLDRIQKYQDQKIDAQIMMATDLVKQKKFDQARKILSTINPKKIPHTQQEAFALISGEVSLGLREYKDALLHFEKAVKKMENPLPTYAQIFDIYIILKQFDKAEALLPKMTINSDVFYSYLYYSKKDYTKAVEYIENILAITDSNLVLNNMAAAIYVELEDFERAEEILLNSYKSHPADVTTLNHLAYIYAERQINLDKALAYAEEAVDQDDNIAYMDTLAWVYMQRDELDKAGDVFERIEKKIAEGRESEDQLKEIFEHLEIYYQKIGKTYQKPK
ncbi:MAG: tetratricopeptide repeat protein [Brevinema sp.]